MGINCNKVRLTKAVTLWFYSVQELELQYHWVFHRQRRQCVMSRCVQRQLELTRSLNTSARKECNSGNTMSTTFYPNTQCYTVYNSKWKFPIHAHIRKSYLAPSHRNRLCFRWKSELHFDHAVNAYIYNNKVCVWVRVCACVCIRMCKWEHLCHSEEK